MATITLATRPGEKMEVIGFDISNIDFSDPNISHITFTNCIADISIFKDVWLSVDLNKGEVTHESRI